MSHRSELSAFLDDSTGNAEAFHRLRNTTIDSNNMDDGPDFVLADAISDRAAAVELPFGHLSQSANH